MRRTSFIIASLLTGVLIHLVFSRFLTVFQIGPDVLFLFVIAYAFILGPLMGETLGFGWGLLADSFGTSLFGVQSLLFALPGYLCGKLKRRVDSERPIPQVVIAIVASGFYSGGILFVQSTMEEVGYRLSVGTFLLKVFMNALLVTIVFWMSNRWIALWKIDPDHP